MPGGKVPTGASTAQARTQATADSAFIREAAAGNVLEVRLGTLAGQKASSPAVKQFAQRMVSDHTTMGNQWTALISRNGLPIKSNLDATQLQTVSQLGSLSGAAFDQAYMSTMVQDHQQDVSRFQSLGPSAQSADVRQLAASGLATMQQHLSMAQQVASQVGSPGTVATTPQYPQAPTQPGQVVTQPAPPGQVATQPVKGRADVRADRKYIQEVAYDHILEVRLAELAQQKATNSDVKQFANRAANNFNHWLNRWSQVASNNGVQVNQNMGPDHRSKLERLEKTSRGQFDRVYLDIVAEHLGSVVPYFQKEGRDARSANVRNLVQEELPAVQQQLEFARSYKGQVRADAKASGKARKVASEK